MSKPINVLIMFHGMVPELRPSDPFETYDSFYNALVKVKQNLPNVINKKIYVQWGHETEDTLPEKIRDDQKLTRAQSFVYNRVSYDAVRTDMSPNNVLLSGIFGRDYGLPYVRNLITLVREEIVLYGFGDVIYYCSPEGEKRVRSVVYDKVLTELDEFENEEDVRLHLVGHSLGVTLTHDFLYGLFAKGHKPDFIKEKQGDETAVKLFSKWRDKAQNNKVHLGTLISFASQLPLFVMRKQRLVNKLFNEELLDPAVIGIVDQTTVRWLIFYDIDDILGFATRRLYDPTDAIKEIQVDSGDTPDHAHAKYWENKTVIRETANLIFNNSSV